MVRDQMLSRKQMPDVQTDEYVVQPFYLKGVLTLA